MRQLDAVSSRVLAGLASVVPRLLAGTDAMAFIDVDDTIRQVHGYRKQGAAYGYSGVKGLNAQLAVLSSPTCAPVIAASRLRKGNAVSGHGAHRLIGDALATARTAGASGQVMVRADSGYYRRDVIAAARAGKAWFSVTVRMNPAVVRAIAGIPETAWTTIKYPRAVWDEDEKRWVSEAQVAEATFTAFTSAPKKQQVSCRLVVRRVQRLSPRATAAGQGELFSTWRHHGFVTNSTLTTIAADETHRDHAIVEQVIAELKNGPLAHAPSGKFLANAAWLTLACLAFNLLRTAGVAASARHAKARWATAPSWWLSPPGSRRPLAGWCCTCRRTGPGRPRGTTSGPPPPPRHPDHPAYRPEEPPDVEEPDRPAAPPRHRATDQGISGRKRQLSPRKSSLVDQGSARPAGPALPER